METYREPGITFDGVPPTVAEDLPAEVMAGMGNLPPDVKVGFTNPDINDGTKITHYLWLAAADAKVYSTVVGSRPGQKDINVSIGRQETTFQLGYGLSYLSLGAAEKDLADWPLLTTSRMLVNEGLKRAAAAGVLLKAKNPAKALPPVKLTPDDVKDLYGAFDACLREGTLAVRMRVAPPDQQATRLGRLAARVAKFADPDVLATLAARKTVQRPLDDDMRAEITTSRDTVATLADILFISDVAGAMAAVGAETARGTAIQGARKSGVWADLRALQARQDSITKTFLAKGDFSTLDTDAYIREANGITRRMLVLREELGMPAESLAAAVKQLDEWVRFTGRDRLVESRPLPAETAEAPADEPPVIGVMAVGAEAEVDDDRDEELAGLKARAETLRAEITRLYGVFPSGQALKRGGLRAAEGVLAQGDESGGIERLGADEARRTLGMLLYASNQTIEYGTDEARQIIAGLCAAERNLTAELERITLRKSDRPLERAVDRLFCDRAALETLLTQQPNQAQMAPYIAALGSIFDLTEADTDTAASHGAERTGRIVAAEEQPGGSAAAGRKELLARIAAEQLDVVVFPDDAAPVQRWRDLRADIERHVAEVDAPQIEEWRIQLLDELVQEFKEHGAMLYRTRPGSLEEPSPWYVAYLPLDDELTVVVAEHPLADRATYVVYDEDWEELITNYRRADARGLGAEQIVHPTKTGLSVTEQKTRHERRLRHTLGI